MSHTSPSAEVETNLSSRLSEKQKQETAALITQWSKEVHEPDSVSSPLTTSQKQHAQNLFRTWTKEMQRNENANEGRGRNSHKSTSSSQYLPPHSSPRQDTFYENDYDRSHERRHDRNTPHYDRKSPRHQQANYHQVSHFKLS